MGVRLIDNKDKIIAQIKEKLAEGINEACQFFVDEARENANVDTGFMFTHIGQTVAATAGTLFGVVRSLAPYSLFQDTGSRGNLFWTRAYLATRAKFKLFAQGIFLRAGGDPKQGRIAKAALHEFQHHVTDHGFKVTKQKAAGGGFLMRGAGGRYVGVYGGRA